MANSPEDLEFNPVYQALQSRYSSQYEHAKQSRWLVCIPITTSLSSLPVSKQLIENHLLEPSALFRDVYQSSGPNKLSWSLSGNTLHCINPKSESRDYHVTVLAEELAYNKSLKSFKMFIIDRPLDPDYKLPRGEPPGTGSSVRLKDALKRKATYEEHAEFLQSFHKYREGLEELNRQIKLFKQNYLIVQVESLLLDTATTLERLVRQGNTAFVEANKEDPQLRDRRVLDACWLSIEGYVMHHIHSKLFPAVCAVHAKPDRGFSERCRLLRGKLTPSAVGVPDDYECKYPSTLAHLRLLESLSTPLEMLYVIQDAMESIMDDVKENFVHSLRIGEPVALASDDLIIVVATILTQLDCKCLLSCLYYMEHFHWVFSDSDQLSFILVTFQAAVEYLKGPEMKKYLPSPPRPTRPQPQVSPSFPKGGSRDNKSLSPNLSLSISEDSCSSGSGTTSTLSQALMAQLGGMSLEDKKKQGHLKPKEQEQYQDTGLGPFLSRLQETDNVVTSSDYYRNS